MDHLCRHVRRLDVIRVLDTVVDAFKSILDHQGCFNRLVHSLILGFEVRSRDLHVAIKKILEDI